MFDNVFILIFAIILIVCASAAVLFILIVSVLHIVERVKLKKLPILESPAKLYAVSAEEWNPPIRRGGRYTFYYLTFELDNNKRKTFTVNRKICDNISENTSGILTYKEHGKLKQFVSFTKHQQ